MNKLTKNLLSLAIAGVMTIPAAAIDISVQLDGETVGFPDAAPEITNSRTMVPFRAMAEAMGYTVGWDDETRRVTAEHNGRTLSFKVGDDELLVRETPDSEWVASKMDVSPYISLDRTYVPVRFFAEAFGQSVKWADDVKTAVIYDRQRMIDSIDKDFSIVNAADAAEKTAVGSKSYMSYTYKLSDSDEILALVEVSTERGDGKTLYEMNLDFGKLIEYADESAEDFEIPMDESVAPIFGIFDGLADVEIDSDEIDPEFSYSNGIYDFMGEDGIFGISMISDGTNIYVKSPQINAVILAAVADEGVDPSVLGNEIWLKLPANEIGYDYNTLGEMLFTMFEDSDPTEIVDGVNQCLGLLDYLNDKYFKKTNDGWVLDYSDEKLTAAGSVSADYRDFAVNVTTVDDNGVGELTLTTNVLDYAPEIAPDGMIIDLTEIDLLG